MAQSVSGSSASESTLELKIITDAPSASVTGGFSAIDGFNVNSFTLDAAGTQFTLYNSASATPADFSVFEYNVGQDLNSDGVIGHAVLTLMAQQFRLVHTVLAINSITNRLAVVFYLVQHSVPITLFSKHLVKLSLSMEIFISTISSS